MKNPYRPCPFCGSSKIQGTYARIEGLNHFVICCDACGMIVTSFNDKDEMTFDVIDRYNRRAGDDQ